MTYPRFRTASTGPRRSSQIAASTMAASTAESYSAPLIRTTLPMFWCASMNRRMSVKSRATLRGFPRVTDKIIPASRTNSADGTGGLGASLTIPHRATHATGEQPLIVVNQVRQKGEALSSPALAPDGALSRFSETSAGPPPAGGAPVEQSPPLAPRAYQNCAPDIASSEAFQRRTSVACQAHSELRRANSRSQVNIHRHRQRLQALSPEVIPERSCTP